MRKLKISLIIIYRRIIDVKSNLLLYSHNSKKGYVCLILIAAGILGITTRIQFPGPIITPDSHNYIRLANNLVEHHCYGYIDIDSEICEPTWGFQPPGYPVFISIVGLLFGKDLELVDFAQKIVFSQIIIFMIAVIKILWVSYSWHKSLIGLITTSLIISLSPLSVAWSRWVLTETLAAAAGLWVFAIVIQSLRDREVPIFRAGLSVAVATFIRWDMVWFLVPVVLCVLFLSGIKGGLDKYIKIGLLTGFPIVVMMIRAACVGLPLIPGGVSPESDPWLPNGAVSFWKVAAVTQDATANFLWPIWGRQYSNIAVNFDIESIHPSYRSSSLVNIIESISMLPDGEPIPVDLDRELELLSLPSSKGGLITRIHIYLQRAFNIWTIKDTVFFSGWANMPKALMVENFAKVYKVFLLIACLGFLFYARDERLVLNLGFVALIFFRTMFLSFLTMIEIRYLVPIFPVMEISIMSLFINKNRK